MSDVCDAANKEDVTAVGLHTTMSSQQTQRQTQETHHLGFNCIVGFHFSCKRKEIVLYYYINCTFHCLLQAKSWLDSWEAARGGGGGFVVVVVVAAQRAALYYIYSRHCEARRAGPAATTRHQGWAGHCRTPPRPLAGWGALTPGHLASPGPLGRAELLSSPSEMPRTLPWGGCHKAWPRGVWAASVSQYLASFSLGVHRGRERGVAVSVVVTKCVVCIPSL